MPARPMNRARRTRRDALLAKHGKGGMREYQVTVLDRNGRRYGTVVKAGNETAAGRRGRAFIASTHQAPASQYTVVNVRPVG